MYIYIYKYIHIMYIIYGYIFTQMNIYKVNNYMMYIDKNKYKP